MGKKKLTVRQDIFCKEYIIDLNATQAALRAGYSKKTAYSIGSENLNKPEIQERIAELRKKQEKKLEISFEDVLKRAWQIASEEERDRSRGVEIVNKMMGFYEKHNEQKQIAIPPLLWADDSEEEDEE